MSDKTTVPTRFVGCDVGKRDIHIFDSHTQRSTRLPNEPAALVDFAAGLDATCLVVCEGTGGYEAALLDAVTQAGHTIHRADARKVKAFIRSFGTLAKTDALDARALARYGQERAAAVGGGLAPWVPLDRQRDRLRLLVHTRRDLVEQRVACCNRIAAPLAAPVVQYLQAVRDTLDQQIRILDKDIQALIHADKQLERAIATLRTIKGLGNTTAAALLALMPELGSLQRRQAASLAGLAPHPRQSGNANLYRSTRGGRSEIKRTLFMAALAAIRHNPQLRQFYKRLIDNGKKPLVAITAVMRKIITIANARLKPIFN